jgi:two-component system NtrC family response regulator
VTNLRASLIGESLPMRELRGTIERLAPTDLSVLIVGPTGAGKELVAQALHELSGRGGSFVPVNVAAVPEAMFEDEFFGHIRGAFTGAIRDRGGLLSEAHHGTLFLDEIGALGYTVQPKLLRVLETHRFRAVGARADQHSDFRALAATNEDLDALIDSGRFRRDLRRRLNDCVIRVPSLHERRDDIALLARHFAGAVPVASEAVRALEAHDWPDNVRELRQVVACGVAMGDGRALSAADVRFALGDRPTRAHRPPTAELLLDRARLLKVLEASRWNTARAASELGIHRSTIYRRMRRVGLGLSGIPSESKVKGREFARIRAVSGATAREHCEHSEASDVD